MVKCTTQAQRDMVRELCDAAEKAWDAAEKALGPSNPEKTVVEFEHNGKTYYSTVTNFRTFVDTTRWKPVCCRWH